MKTTRTASLLTEGKTKKIFKISHTPHHALVQYKNDITAFDDPSFTKQFNKKAEYSNTTNAGVFSLLKKAGIPTAFIQKQSETEFVTERCTMIPLEVVARRYAVGSYLKREPQYTRTEGTPPHSFDNIVTEFFLKTTRGELHGAHGEILVDGLDPKKGEEDPFIPNPFEGTWHLAHPKKPIQEASLGKNLSARSVATEEQMHHMSRLAQEAFIVLENFFAQHDFKFIDFKIEFGVTHDGRLVIADVIDNDSWRLRDQNWNDVSKQSFRDGEPLAHIEDKYALVAKLFK